MHIRISIGWQGPQDGAEKAQHGVARGVSIGPGWAYVSLSPARRLWGALAVSGLLHGALGVVLIVASSLLPMEQTPWFRYPISIEYLDLRAPGDTSILYLPGAVASHGEEHAARSASAPVRHEAVEAIAIRRELPALERRPEPLRLPDQMGSAVRTGPSPAPGWRLPAPRDLHPKLERSGNPAYPLESAVNPPRAQTGGEAQAAPRAASSLPEAIGTGLAEPRAADPEEVQNALRSLPANRTAALGLALFGPSLFEPSALREIQMVHPENGQFDVVLVQSGQVEMPGVHFLKGSPIYTVYLNVGTAKPWTLHYCSTEPLVRISEHVVHIGAGGPMAPPYPKLTVVPAETALPGIVSRMALHGLIDVQGHLRDVEPVQSEDQASWIRLIPFLRKWLFRPATQAGVPVAVDVLLVIPSAQ